MKKEVVSDVGSREIPRGLKLWFIVHFVADVAFAIPLFVLPRRFLTLLGWTAVDPITTRMVAAALLGIGIESLLSRNGEVGLLSLDANPEDHLVLRSGHWVVHRLGGGTFRVSRCGSGLFDGIYPV